MRECRQEAHEYILRAIRLVLLVEVAQFRTVVPKPRQTHAQTSTLQHIENCWFAVFDEYGRPTTCNRMLWHRRRRLTRHPACPNLVQ